jgi:hypothetical protein
LEQPFGSVFLYLTFSLSVPEHLGDSIAAYDFGRRLKIPKGLASYATVAREANSATLTLNNGLANAGVALLIAGTIFLSL